MTVPLARRGRSTLNGHAEASQPQTKQASPRRILVIVVLAVDDLGLVAPLQVFSAAHRLAKQTVYSIQVVTPSGGLEVGR